MGVVGAREADRSRGAAAAVLFAGNVVQNRWNV